jgi:hypothetical protein
MKRGFWVALVLVGCLAGWLGASQQVCAQAPAAPSAPGQARPGGSAQKTPATAPPTESNPFPEDTSTVPVMPSTTAPALPEGTYDGAESSAIPFPGDDFDPVRSPDDPAPAEASGQGENSSSSLKGLDQLLPKPEDEQANKKKKAEKEPTHQEAASRDIQVGGYYLDTKNWKGALSRFESALVLDPENPEVYWGLAEADRHLGAFADARAYYQKVIEYDPDSRYGKEARKALKEPEIANARSASPAPSAVETPK